MAITPQQARAELARRELARRKAAREQPEQPVQQQGMEAQNLVGQSFNVPAAANRSLLQGSGYQQGAMNPSQVPSFGELAQQQFPLRSDNAGTLIGDVATRMPMQAGAAALDIATDPAQIALLGAGAVASKMPIVKAMAGKGVQALKKILKFDNALTQAKQSKIALDTIRDVYGKAKEIALQEVKDLPIEFNWKKIPDKVLSKLRDPNNGYEVAFTDKGEIVNTMVNIDKVKMALQDMPSTKDFVEAGNMAKRQIIKVSGEVRDAMVKVANDAGKPELGKSLEKYHEFMNNYNLANDHLVDKYGNAMANKLKSTFSIISEPAVKEAWKNIAKGSPEIKGIIRSRNNRELLKDLLIAGPSISSAKKVITGKWGL